VLGQEDFSSALSTLNVEWSSKFAKVTEFFAQLDFAANQGQLRFFTVTDLGEAILLNSSRNVDDFVSESLLLIHKALKDRNMLGRLRDLFNFMNSNRDETIEIAEFKRIVKEMLEEGAGRAVPLLTDAKYDQIVMRYHISA
jgi:hypothetical protein